MPFEVRVVPLDGVEILDVEHLSQAAGTVPEGDLAAGVQSPELIENVRAHRCHTRSTADEEHLGVGLASEELAERPGNHHLIARLEVEDEGRHQPGRRAGRRFGRRRGDPHVEHDDVLLERVAGHGVSSLDGFANSSGQLPQVVAVPVGTVDFLDVDVLEVHGARRGP